VWDIDSTTDLLRDMSAADEPDELLRLVLAHARRNVDFARAVVLSREGLEFPLFRVVLRVDCDDSPVCTAVEDPDFARAGGLLAELLYAGEFHTATSLPPQRSDPARDLLAESRFLVAFPLFERGASVGMVVLLGPSPHICDTTELCGLAIMGALLQRDDRGTALTRKLKATCRSLDDEMSAAASVQRWLLPAPPALNSRVGIASSYRTAHHSGGDYYDTGELPDGRFGVMIADVSGHGAAAAVLMAILRTIVHDEVDRSRVVGPSALLDHADARLCALGLASRGWFVTAFSGSLDTLTGEFSYSCAGHPPPRLLRAKNRKIIPLDGASTVPLGVLNEKPPREVATVMLEPGDLLLFYSDGITEARSRGGEFLGVAGLDRILRELPGQVTPDMAVDAIKQAVHAFAGVDVPTDDQTLLALRWGE
jgi:sigma-B regulation protein RsbU (phosphoserine phosphatase)